MKHTDIIEIGSGDCSKISILLESIAFPNMSTIRYIPIDVSQTAIEESVASLSGRFTSLMIHGIVADFITQLDLIPRYDYLIKLADTLEAMKDEFKIESNGIPGCQSRVWMIAKLQDGKVYYKASSGSKLTRGLIKLLLIIFNGQPAQAIQTAELSFIDLIGLRFNLSPSRAKVMPNR